MAAANGKAPSKGEILKTAADEAGLSRKQVSAVLESLSGQIRKSLGKKGVGTFTVPGLMRINVVNKPATKGARGSIRSPGWRRCSRPSPRARRQGTPPEEPEGNGQVRTASSKVFWEGNPQQPTLASTAMPGSFFCARHVAKHDRFPQPRERVPGGDELLSDVSLIAHVDQGRHDRRIVDLLLGHPVPAGPGCRPCERGRCSPCTAGCG